MADSLDIVFKIAADISGLKDGVDKAAKSLGEMESFAGRLGAAMVGAFSVGAAISFAKAIADDADALVKMSDRTGASIEGLQRLQIAGDDAGNTIEQMTQAINQLQNRLAGGDDSAVSALGKLGLSIETIKAQRPDQAFITISDAIRNVKDPTEQTRIAMELFGKSGAEILPTLKRGFDDLKGAAVGMSEETVRAFDEAGDTIARWTRITKGYAAEGIVAFVHFIEAGLDPATGALQRNAAAMDREAKRLKALADETASQIAAAEAYAKAISGEVGPMMDASTQQRIYAALLKKQEDELKNVQEEQKKARAELEKWNKSVDDATIKMNLSVFTLHRFGAIELPNVKSSLDGVDTEINNLASRDLPNFNTNIYETGKRWKTVGDLLNDTGSKTLPALAQGFAELAQVTDGSFSQIARTIGTVISAFSLGQTAISNLNDAIDAGTASVGDYAKAAATLVGIFITVGRTIQDLIPSIGDITGLKRQQSVISLANYLHSLGITLEDLKLRADRAGISLDRLLNAKTPSDTQAAIDELNDAFRQQDEAFRFLEDTVKKYGFSLEELGPKFAQQQLTKQAFDLEKEFKALEAAGVDVSVISEHMKDAINDYLHAALKTGAAVPESMRGILQQLANMGLLTDENGNAITDLEAAGIHFSKSLDEQFADLIKTINKLIDAITKGLGGAISSIPKDINVDANVNIHKNGGGGSWNDFPTNGDVLQGLSTGGFVSRGKILHFDTGGVATASGKDRIPALLAEGEMVLTPGQQSYLGVDGSVPALLTALLKAVQADRYTTVVIGEDSVARATHRAWERNPSGLRTEARELLGVA